MRLYTIKHMKLNKNALHQVTLDNGDRLLCDSFGDYCNPENGQCYRPLYDEDGTLVGFVTNFYEYTF